MANDLSLNTDEINSIQSSTCIREYEERDINIEDESTQLDGNESENNFNSSKRRRESDSNEIWHQQKRNSKKYQKNPENSLRIMPESLQISVTSKEKLPKQFALAKILRNLEITDVLKVKYVNPFKILITFNNETSADKFILSESLIAKGWRMQRTWEVGLSYGIIRDIDLDVSDEEALKYISSEADVITAKRLQRRSEEGWIASESMRIGFNGSKLPEYISLNGLRVAVEPYVFPVTQCSRCWRFGHTPKMCPSNKIICPKCSKLHPNCETLDFKCPNCHGNHLALAKICPTYIKEKKIREIMSEYNCTYRRALSIYVPPSPDPIVTLTSSHGGLPRSEEERTAPHVYAPQCLTPSYAQVTSNEIQATVHAENHSRPAPNEHKNRKKPLKKKVQHRNEDEFFADFEMSTDSDSSDAEKSHSGEESQSNEKREKNNKQEAPTNKKPESFKELSEKLKNIVFMRNITFLEKIKSLTNTTVEWLISLVVSMIADVSIFRNLFSVSNG